METVDYSIVQYRVATKVTLLVFLQRFSKEIHISFRENVANFASVRKEDFSKFSRKYFSSQPSLGSGRFIGDYSSLWDSQSQS